MTSDQDEYVGTGEPTSTEPYSTPYNVFILIMTLYSMIIMVALLVPWLSQATKSTLHLIDTLMCVIFLGDFLSSLHRAPNSRVYFFRQGGWLDILGSIPSIPVLPLTAVLRLARLGRLARIIRSLRGEDSKQLWADFIADRARSALLVTILVAVFFITISSVFVLQVESRFEDANIVTGVDAFWWALVTVTTIGYGDQYPVSNLGRLLAMPLMLIGVAIYGVLTSYLATVFIGPSDAEVETEMETAHIEADIAHLKEDLATIKEMIRDLNR